MTKKRKLIFYVAVSTICLLASSYTIKFIADSPYRNQIPGNIDLSTFSKPVREQISAARRNAILFTTSATLGRLAMVYHSCGDYDNAARCYQLALKKNTHRWEWNYFLGYLFLEKGQSKAAIENFNQVIEKDPENYFAFYYSGEAFRELGSIDSARKMFSKIISETKEDNDEKATIRECSFPLKTYAMFQLARICQNANRPDSAAILLKTLIANQETFGPAYRLLATIYSTAGNITAANTYSIRANDLRDYNPPADYLLDKIAMLSCSDQYLLKQVEDAVRSGNYRWALTLCDQALKYYPENKTLISNAVFENFRQGNDKKALQYLNKHFEYFSNDAKELMDVTDLLYNTKHLPEAIKYFNQVKKLMPKNTSLAIWLFERGKKNEAIAMMNEFIKQNPGDEKILADNIRLLIDLGDDETAGKYFLTLINQSPSGAETLRIKGLLAEKEGNPDSARLAYEAAYALDPEDLIFTRKIIDFYIRQKNWQQAISHFKSALELHPNEPFLLEGLGRILIACPDAALRNIPGGILYSERAFINYKTGYDTRLSAGKNLATAYLSMGDKKNATKYINQTIKLAEKGNQSKEYIAYFKALVSK